MKDHRLNSVEWKRITTNGTLHFGLKPLEEAPVVKKMPAGGQLPTVEELSQANSASLVWS